MQQIFVLVLLATLNVFFLQVDSAEKEDGGDALEPQSEINFTISVLRNSSDGWITQFSAEKAVSYSKNGTILDIKQTIFRRKQKDIVRISGVIRDAQSEGYVYVMSRRNGEEDRGSMINKTALGDCKEVLPDALKFHEKTGKKIVLINNSRTAYRQNPYDLQYNGGLITSRPLLDDEMFQVQIDKVINKWNSSGVFPGVTLRKPQDVDLNYITDYGNGTWDLRYSNVRLDGKTIKSYPLRLEYLPVGTRIGVMRKKNGDLHFFLNGLDKGVAATNVPGPVYGIFDLSHFAEQVTIVD